MVNIKAGKASFTLLEILIAILILTVVATLALAGYTRAVENANAMACQNNLLILQTAIELYGSEHPNDALPASLSSIWPQYGDRALAKARIELEKRGWPSYAYASDFSKYYGADISLITCPSDPTPPPGGTSYGINYGSFPTAASLKDASKANEILIGDSDTPFMTAPVARHKSGFFAKDTSYVVTGDGDLEEHKHATGEKKLKKKGKKHKD